MYRTAESVSPKHPDKICDRVSDAILDEALRQDPYARVAVECLGGHGKITVMGEVTLNGKIDALPIIKRIAGPSIEARVHLHVQSPEIAQGVDTGGAGDQGIMVGYATSATPDYIPLETWLSRDLNRYLFKTWPFDGKTQVTLKNNRIDSIVASFQNSDTEELKQAVAEWLNEHADGKVTIHANPAGQWQIGGFDADTGLTGRKLAVDNYGPHIPVGGGAFSGKDATKVDRSAAYMARKIAVDYLHKYNAKEVIVHLAYAIGLPEPVHAQATVDGRKVKVTGYDLTPRGIIETLDLRNPQFESTANYGHFGNNYPWDQP